MESDTKTIIEVSTGEVTTGASDCVLVASAIGSCVTVIAYDTARCLGGIAHVMLPGSCPDHKRDEAFRYAENAIRELFVQMKNLGSTSSSITVCIAGGGNVLRRSDDTICRSNITSVLNILRREGFTIAAESLGGMKRRRIRLDVSTGCITCAIGDGIETLLWKH